MVAAGGAATAPGGLGHAGWESGGVRVTRGSLVWVRRGAFALVMAATAAAPGPASGSQPPACAGPGCVAPGTVRWSRPLPGTWAVGGPDDGVTPARGQAYAAMSARVAAIGYRMAVHAYQARTGASLWTARLRGFPAGSAVVAVRAWPGVITVGVSRTTSAGTARQTVVLDAATGRRLHAYPAAPFGGAVAASAARTVVVGPHAVTSYDNSNGAVVWQRATGRAEQAWRVDGGDLYVSVAAGGYLGAAPVTALRRIDLRTGAERVVRPRAPHAAGHDAAFAGRLGLAYDGVVVFTGAAGVTAYSGQTGTVLWRRPGAVPDTVDAVARRIYLTVGDTLVGVSPRTGRIGARVPGAGSGGSSGLYGVRDGAVLGIDVGGSGDAWGYDIAARRVLWTSPPLPWPHYFVGASGIGGSAAPGRDTVLLGVCAQVGNARAHAAQPECARPELVALNR